MALSPWCPESFGGSLVFTQWLCVLGEWRPVNYGLWLREAWCMQNESGTEEYKSDQEAVSASGVHADCTRVPGT